MENVDKIAVPQESLGEQLRMTNIELIDREINELKKKVEEINQQIIELEGQKEALDPEWVSKVNLVSGNTSQDQ